jgi:hypothetical protein
MIEGLTDSALLDAAAQPSLRKLDRDLVLVNNGVVDQYRAGDSAAGLPDQVTFGAR